MALIELVMGTVQIVMSRKASWDWPAGGEEQGHLTNKRGLQRKTGVEISCENFEILGAEQHKFS